MKFIISLILTIGLVCSTFGKVIEVSVAKPYNMGSDGYLVVDPSCIWEGWVKMSLCISNSIDAKEYPKGKGYLEFLVDTARRLGIEESKIGTNIPKLAKGAVLPTGCIIEGITTYKRCHIPKLNTNKISETEGTNSEQLGSKESSSENCHENCFLDMIEILGLCVKNQTRALTSEEAAAYDEMSSFVRYSTGQSYIPFETQELDENHFLGCTIYALTQYYYYSGCL